ncbi:hypothetical protein [Marininema halotolerans]|uniref:Uncharacterized protein n=1 Tax=Marininema halotolerans TaxID=1155944 RepID=A0A1I6SX41_9BACL|nr:hypothetical protein [Marininema halotolerans]SFS81463.1 hypothetical protein SAMN05444972_10896 [Marininema halotolerans]
MKVTSVLLNIQEADFDLYQEELVNLGWSKINNQRVFRKTFDETEVEVREHLPTFSADLYLSVSARNHDGIKQSTIERIFHELRKADKTPDE